VREHGGERTLNGFGGACALIASAGFDMLDSCRLDATAAFPRLEAVSACREGCSRIRRIQLAPNRVRHVELPLIASAGHEAVLDFELLHITSYLCKYCKKVQYKKKFACPALLAARREQRPVQTRVAELPVETRAAASPTRGGTQPAEKQAGC
jgi:hypothetical protein